MEVKIKKPIIEFEEASGRSIEELREIAKLRNMDERTRTQYLLRKEQEQTNDK